MHLCTDDKQDNGKNYASRHDMMHKAVGISRQLPKRRVTHPLYASSYQEIGAEWSQLKLNAEVL
ncbi:hypothetical protein PsorP6_012856 [Peronosclerospora sorghi]|uniref:Uncharacterized protein n=1 Tax=Peronosclerospora sorghi TaxID=230839 RepID=A0ACC0WFG0_9STRA|nr:hypothetical protein PsorP6_012856 [Peronosclerospora sorghi]